MSKRLTDTEKWFDPWFRELPGEYKNFWNFLCDRCDSAGVWKKDFKFASYIIGNNVDEARATELFGGRIMPLKDGYWLISGFVQFQYGELTEACRPHRSIISIIESHRVSKGYPKGLDRPKDKEQDKDKVKDKEKETEGDARGRKFAKPTPEEIAAYADSIGFKLEGHKFFDYYESKGWMIGKNTMKDWKAAVRTWKGSQFENGATAPRPPRTYKVWVVDRKNNAVIKEYSEPTASEAHAKCEKLKDELDLERFTAEVR